MSFVFLTHLLILKVNDLFFKAVSWNRVWRELPPSLSDAPLCSVGGICFSVSSQTDSKDPLVAMSCNYSGCVCECVCEWVREREREREENGWTESPRVEIPFDLDFFLVLKKLSLSYVCILLKGFAGCEGSKIDLILKEREGWMAPRTAAVRLSEVAERGLAWASGRLLLLPRHITQVRRQPSLLVPPHVDTHFLAIGWDLVGKTTFGPWVMYGRVSGDTEEAWSLLTTVALTAIVYKDVTLERIAGHLNSQMWHRRSYSVSIPALLDAIERYIVPKVVVIGIT